MKRNFLNDAKMFQNKVVLITGASRGIGRDLAIMFAKFGASLVLNYRSQEQEMQKTAESLAEYCSDSLICKCDVSEYAEVKEMVDKVISQYGRIDVLINNAGISLPKFFMETNEDEWDLMIKTNLKSLYNCCHNILPYMMEKRKGKVINMSSVVAKSGSIGAGVHYSAAKAGVIGLTKALADQFAEYGINVNAIAPAMIDTEMIRWRSPELLKEHIEKIPLKRLGLTSEVSGAALFLASEYSDFITGYTMDINGGMYMD